MRRHHVYFKKYTPSWIEDEYDRLGSAYLSRGTTKNLREVIDPDGLKAYINSHASDELKLWDKYSSFTGDEGQLCDKNGEYLLDSNGDWIQEWTSDEDGFVSDEYGNPVFYSDGERVRKPQREDFMPYIDKWFPKHKEE